MPVWRLLGGQVRERVKVYTHLGLGDMRAVYETIRRAAGRARPRHRRALGYRAIKVVIIPYTHYRAPMTQVDHVARMMAAL